MAHPVDRTPPDRRWLFLVAVFGGLYAAAVIFRPVMPIDETRYLTVAWEMWLRHDWLAPLTVNFEPYHHKPPLLFWLINASWSIFGVNRWAAVIPVVLASMGSVALTIALCRRLFPSLQARASLVLIGSFAFVIYSTLILFDLTLTLFVIGALLCILAYSQERRSRHVVLLGLLLGLGVLTKGPVAYLYVLFPVLLAPFWQTEPGRLKSWYLGHLAAFLISLIPIALWLVPVLRASSNEFGYWLVWEQTAGRITGSYEASHDRPFFFYLLVLPILLTPWVFFGHFWRGFGKVRREMTADPGLRFVVAWIAPTLVAFSLIGGKQPHYLVPMLPGMAILIAWMLDGVPLRALQRVTVTMVVLFVVGQIASYGPVHARYDLRPVAEFVSAHKDTPFAFAGGHYRGELTFLGRLERSLDTPRIDELDAWFAEHPGGMAIVRYTDPEEIAGRELLMTHLYRGQRIGIIATPAATTSEMISLQKPRSTNE